MGLLSFHSPLFCSFSVNKFFLKCKDIAGAESSTIQFPDSTKYSEVQTWIVKPVMGDILIVDDYPLDNSNNVLIDNKWLLENERLNSDPEPHPLGYELGKNQP